MFRFFIKTLFYFSTLFVLSSNAYAAISDMDFLTCNIPAGEQSIHLAWSRLSANSIKKGDGQFEIEGPIREGELCIRKISITAAFGVLMVSAELCDSKTKTILDWLRSQRPTLKKSTIASPAGVIAAFGEEKDSFSIFMGNTASSFPNPDPKSRQISYFCVKQFSGPQ
jgi:hypothetical protein